MIASGRLAARLSLALLLFGSGCAASTIDTRPGEHRDPQAPSRDLALALELRISRWGPPPAEFFLPRVFPTSKQTLQAEWHAEQQATHTRTPSMKKQRSRPLRVSGPLDATQAPPARLRYAARLRTRPGKTLPPLKAWPTATAELAAFVIPTSKLPARSPLVRRFLISRVGPRLDAGQRDVVRAILAALKAQIEIRREPGLGPDVLTGLRTGVTTPIGWSRILVTCLRTAQIPARLAAGVDLDGPPGRRFRRWAEVFARGRWWPLDPPHAPPGQLPSGVVELDHGDLRFIPRSPGTRLRYTLLPLLLRPDDDLGDAAHAALDAAAQARPGS